MPTIEETMAEAFDAAEARAAEAEKPVEVDPVETAKMPEEQAPASDGPARGPDGKFISKTVEAPEAATPAEPNPAEGAAQADATVTASPSPGAPLSWSAESKAAWSSLPPAIQQEVLKREAEIQKGLDERAAKLRSYEPVEQVLAPRRQQLVAQYGSEAAALNELFMLSDFAARDPGGFIAWFAQQRGVNLGQPAPSGEQADPNDPIAALNRQVEDLRNQLALERRSQLVSQVERFKASGKAPHFEAVRQDMARIAQVEPNLSLEDLYERAIWLNPTVRAQLLDEQKKAQEAELAKQREAIEKARKAEEAKRIAQANVSTKGAAGASPAPKKSIEEEMAEVYDRRNAA